MRSLFAEKRSLILWIVLIISSFAWFGFCFHDFSQALLNHTYTPDFPWLLNTGRYMLSHHRLPQHDIFSWALSEHPWLLYQWLFEVLIAWIYQLIGEQAFIHSFIVLVALLYFVFPIVFGMSRRVPVLFSSVIAALVLPAIVINISLRPMIVTSFFLAIQYGLLT